MILVIAWIIPVIEEAGGTGDLQGKEGRNSHSHWIGTGQCYR